MTQTRLPIVKQKPLLSASQLGTFMDCQRRWAFEYVWKLERKPNAAAELGSRVHALLEAWSRHGTPPDRKTREGNIALKMLEALPPPGTGYPEQRFYLKAGRHAYTGFIDLPYVDPFYGPTIVDHKTTSDLRWAKTPEILEQDVQANIYARAAFEAFGVDSVRLLWNYGTTGSKPRHLPVYTTLNRRQVEKTFETIEAHADEITRLYLLDVDPFSLSPTVESCEKYGGCPHRERCNLTKEDKWRTLMHQDQARNGNGNGLMASVAELEAFSGGPTSVQPPPPPPAQTPLQQPPQGAPSGGPEGYAQLSPPQGYPQQQPFPQHQQHPQMGTQSAYGQPYPQHQQHPQMGTQPAYGQPPQAAYGQPYQQPQPYQQQLPHTAQPYQPTYQQVPPGYPQGAQTPQAYQQPHGQPYAQQVGVPPNAPEAHQVSPKEAEAQKETAQTEKKRGRPRKATKANLQLEQQAFLAGVSAAIMRGIPAAELRGYGQAAIAAFLEEFPVED